MKEKVNEIGKIEIIIEENGEWIGINIKGDKEKMDSTERAAFDTLMDIIRKGVENGSFSSYKDSKIFTMTIWTTKDGKLKVEELSSYPYPPPLNSF